VATGLARPEVFNWPAHLIEVRDTQHPDAFVLTLGPNDDQDLTGEGGGQSFGSPEWIEEYKRRVGGLMDSVTGDKKHKLFIIGAPVIENVQRADTRYRIINDVYRTEAAKRKGLVEYIDIYTMFVPPGGGYSAYKTNDDGTIVKVRVDDGIHFTREGGDLIAAKVLKELNRAYDLTSWQKSLPSTTTSTTTTTAASTTTKAG